MHGAIVRTIADRYSPGVAQEYLATRRERALRLFRCERCGARGEVSFGAVGISGWHREGLLNDTAVLDAGAEAEVELRRDAERVLAFVRCPTCQRRAPGAVFWAGVRVALWGGLGVGIAAVVGFPLWLLGPPLAALFGTLELLRVRRANRGVFHKLSPGQPLVPVVPPAPAQLPVARVLEVPPPKPLAPIASVAPPPPEPRDPAAAPSLLVDHTAPPSGGIAGNGHAGTGDPTNDRE